jgi:uncharacterized membrane protein YecN with MAPEG domain
MRREYVPFLVGFVAVLAVLEIIASAWWVHLLIVIAIVALLVPVGVAIARSDR